MAAPKGNQYGANRARWRNAIEKALENRCKSDGQKALVAIAEQLIDKAMEGDMQALKELGDRMDGRPAQAVNIGGQEDNPIVITDVILRPLDESDD